VKQLDITEIGSPSHRESTVVPAVRIWLICTTRCPGQGHIRHPSDSSIAFSN
jgi:hypothetical protein